MARPYESASALSRALFRDSAERARAALAVARATDNLPEAAGPYNPQVLAARALEAMDALSPEYLRTFIAALDDLAALQALTTEPEPRKATKKSGAARAGGAKKAGADTPKPAKKSAPTK